MLRGLIYLVVRESSDEIQLVSFGQCTKGHAKTQNNCERKHFRIVSIESIIWFIYAYDVIRVCGLTPD